MKYNRQNCENRLSTNEPTLSINNGGAFFLSESACDILAPTTEPSVEFFYDKKDAQWYIRDNQASGFKTRKNKATSNRRLFQNRYLARILIEDLTGKKLGEVSSVRIPIAHEPTTLGEERWYALITRNASMRST